MTSTIYFVSAAFLLAVGTVLAKFHFSAGDTEMHPLFFLVVQLCGAVVFLMTCAWWSNLRHWNGTLLALAVPGLIMGAGSIFTIFALYFTTASEASFIFATQPVLVLLLAWALLRERVPTLAAALVVLAVFGVGLIVKFGSTELSLNRAQGLMFAAASTTCAAIYVVWMRRATQSEEPILALLMVQSTSLFAAVCAWITAGFPISADVPWVSVPFAASVGAIHYGGAFLLYLFGLREVEAARAGVYLSLVPVFAVVLAFAFLGEQLNAKQIAGAVLVVLAVSGVAWTTAKPNEE